MARNAQFLYAGVERMRTPRPGILFGRFALLHTPDHIHFQALPKAARSSACRNRRDGIYSENLIDRVCRFGFLLERGLPGAVSQSGWIDRRPYLQCEGRLEAVAIGATSPPSETDFASVASAGARAGVDGPPPTPAGSAPTNQFEELV